MKNASAEAIQKKQIGEEFLKLCKFKKFAQAEELLVKCGKDVVNAQDETGKTAVYYCAAYNDSKFLQQLKNAGADLSLKTSINLYPLDVALNMKKYEVASLLIDLTDKIDVTCLGRAIYHKDPISFDLLFKNINRINITAEDYSRLLGYPKYFILAEAVKNDADQMEPVGDEIAFKLIEKAHSESISLSLDNKYIKATFEKAINNNDFKTISALIRFGQGNINLYEGENDILSHSGQKLKDAAQAQGNLKMALYLSTHCKGREKAELIEYITHKLEEKYKGNEEIRQAGGKGENVFLKNEALENMISKFDNSGSINSLQNKALLQLCDNIDKHLDTSIYYPESDTLNTTTVTGDVNIAN